MMGEPARFVGSEEGCVAGSAGHVGKPSRPGSNEGGDARATRRRVKRRLAGVAGSYLFQLAHELRIAAGFGDHLQVHENEPCLTRPLGDSEDTVLEEFERRRELPQPTRVHTGADARSDRVPGRRSLLAKKPRSPMLTNRIRDTPCPFTIDRRDHFAHDRFVDVMVLRRNAIAVPVFHGNQPLISQLSQRPVQFGRNSEKPELAPERRQRGLHEPPPPIGQFEQADELEQQPRAGT
jgi:hypothetical protein